MADSFSRLEDSILFLICEASNGWGHSDLGAKKNCHLSTISYSSLMAECEIKEQDFTGGAAESFGNLFGPDTIRELREKIFSKESQVLSEGRHRVVAIDLEHDGQSLPVVVKVFGKQGGWKDRYDRSRGTKAARSYRAARFLQKHDVGTPEPIAYIDRWEGSRLVESYYFSRYVTDLRSFKDHLLQIYRDQPECDHFVALITHVAQAMRRMHDAGFVHHDLGNQNMEFRQGSGSHWDPVQILDLNRGRIYEELSDAHRALDFARLRLPSKFLVILYLMYWGEKKPPAAFVRALEKHRRRFRWWAMSRKMRHPFRAPPNHGYPEVQDIWIWDSQSAQAAITMMRPERKKHYPRGRHLAVAATTLKYGFGIWKKYQEVLPEAFQKEVSLSGKIGMSLEACDLDVDRQLEYLEPLGKIPVLVRFCHHESEDVWLKTSALVSDLHEKGHDVMLALLQDRKAVTDPASWAYFLKFVISRTAGKVSLIEVSHAVNRMKWGVHSAKEQGQLWEPLVPLMKEYPQLKISGPSCIDFEYHYILSALEEVPEGLHFSALSHHLYVDRRGAPENLQGKFGTVEKCALLKAIAIRAKTCDSRVVVSEVNWPLEGTGIYSPVTASFPRPNEPEHHLHVSAEDYGYFMLRYLVLTLCSGYVDQVFWWRLVAHGFGLVDERAEGGWRGRPGFEMLGHFLKLLGSARFVEKLETREDVYALRFEAEGQEVVMAWCNGGTDAGELGFEFSKVLDVYGDQSADFVLSDAPVYLVR